MQSIEQKIPRLMKVLGYDFNHPKLLIKALTHRSAAYDNNERMEFLGDSILNFVIGEALFNQFTAVKEGKLSQLRAKLVNGNTLAEIAFEFNLGDYILLGGGELKSGGFRRESILADAVEAIIAAIYMDSDMAQAKAFVLRVYQQRLAGIDPDASFKDAKTQLQEWLQARKKPLPDYTLVATDGKDHQQIFTVNCSIATQAKPFQASASSRRKAEQAAAKLALNALKVT